MLRKIGIILLMSLLNACSYFNMDNNTANDQYARCKQIKYKMIYNSATPNQLTAAQRTGELDNLNRAYRENNCS